MRILALRTEGHVLPSIHDSIIRALRAIGFEILDFLLPRNEEEFIRFEIQARRKCHAVFLLDLGREPGFISRVKYLQTSIRIPWIIWFVDDPEGYHFPEACSPEWSVVFCWDRGIAGKTCYIERGFSLIHLPLAADADLFFPEANSPLLFPAGAFVGSTAHSNPFLESSIHLAPGFSEELESVWQIYRSNLKEPADDLAWNFLCGRLGAKREILQSEPLCRLWVYSTVFALGIRKRKTLVKSLIEAGGAVFGDERWAETVGELYLGRVAYGEELRKIYNHSAFVLDIRPSQALTGLSQRAFDAGACGRPVLIEYSPELEMLFSSDDGLFTYSSLEQAAEEKKQCLGPGALQRARKAARTIFTRHTYRDRAQKIMSTLKKL